MSDLLIQAHALLRRAPLVDGHNDLPWALRELVSYNLDQADIAAGFDKTHTDLPRLRVGCVGGQFWSVYVPSSLVGGAAVTATLEQVDFVHQLVARYPDQLGWALTADDVRAQFEAGRIASLIGAEGGHSIDCSMGALRALHALGVRYMTLTHNNNVPWADSATDEPRLGGLSAFGREVVLEMNRLGMLVDLSHVSADTMRDALDATEAPVVFSHSSCRELVDHPRNVPDEVLSRLRDNGGVCMVTFVPDFVSSECAQWSTGLAEHLRGQGLDPWDWGVHTEERQAYAAGQPKPAATLQQVADHIEHAREVAGMEHIGIGGDYDGCDGLPEGLADVTGYPALFAELLRRGWSEQELTKLAGGNVLRVLADAEAVAAAAQQQRSPSLASIADLDAQPAE